MAKKHTADTFRADVYRANEWGNATANVRAKRHTSKEISNFLANETSEEQCSTTVNIFHSFLLHFLLKRAGYVL